ncbi:WD40-repeat-containing domain protein [Achaetomium macrosporum]|uniref:WD40-repeat-containing domain protein n=1 Tax=Achaetomium macrosporum TaxID=79813 RepID=A0AAN7CIE1_9PEZI|nr:WD40-repeat-containing domain protein [Achaetomium macrosporum]
METNGDTASLKRKREPKDDPLLSQKKHRRKSKSKLEGNTIAEDTANANGEHTPSSVAVPPVDGDLELLDASSQPPTGRVCGKLSSWKVSKPMGGRMQDIDPIFSPDERYLIVTYNTSIQVYSTEDSLLVRRISLPVTRTDGTTEFVSTHIVSSVLSKCNTDYVWVTCSDGRIWHINWASGAGADTPFTVEAKRVLDVTVEEVDIGGKPEDVLLVLKKLTRVSAQIVAYNTKALSTRSGKLLHTYDESPQFLRSVAGGRLIVAAAKEALHIGSLKVKQPASLDDLTYRFHCFDTPDIITCLDIRPTLRTTRKGGLELQSVDVAVGGARGAIYVYHDLLSDLPREGSGSVKVGMIQPKKHHWHRRAVHSLKWSEDGNYLISGGYETVLVLWQVDTGRQEFLPHLSASIENIVVSPRGSSYALHLDDNSTMVLSTAEMKPTMYVSGIQSLVLGDRPSKDSLVRRLWRPVDEISAPLVATINPQSPSQLFLCVGNGQQASVGGPSSSTPLLQVFDLSSFHGVSKHAIARTNPTDANITSDGAPIIEPTATKLAFSQDGNWLASVDEWQPPERDADVFLTGSKSLPDVCRERREVYLKFWEVGTGDQSLQLATRINDAHHTDRAETIFDLASDPTSSRFATIGNDGMVRFWVPRLRKRDGPASSGPAGQPLRSWSCSRVVSLPVYEQQDDATDVVKSAPRSGAITFSEDGSVLFAAFGAPSGALVVAIDTETGACRDVVSGMLRGEIRAIKSLSSCLIMLSEDLVVYDIVSDELLYNYSLKETSESARRLTQLAVNYQSRSFALAAPIPNPSQQKMKKGTRSELVVFSVEEDEPQLVKPFVQLITSVCATPSSSGFIVVDAAAQIWSVTEGAEQAPLLQPLADLGMDNGAAAGDPTPEGLLLQEEEASDEEMQDADEDVGLEDDDDTHATVVAPQRLAEIFNAAPAFAMPPIEDIFYQVAALYSTKPVNA